MLAKHTGILGTEGRYLRDTVGEGVLQASVPLVCGEGCPPLPLPGAVITTTDLEPESVFRSQLLCVLFTCSWAAYRLAAGFLAVKREELYPRLRGLPQDWRRRQGLRDAEPFARVRVRRTRLPPDG